MNNSIEISGKTIAYFVIALGVMSGIILFMNKYDNDRKIEKLEIVLNELDRFKTMEIRSMLLNVDLDSLKESEIEEIRSAFSILDNNEEFKNIHRYWSKILVKDNSDFYTAYLDGMRYAKEGKIVKNKALSKKEEKMIHALGNPGVDLKKTIIDEFSFLDAPEIIYPIAMDEKRKVFLCFTYYESR